MEFFDYNDLGHFLADEQPCNLQTADFLNFTPLDDVFAEYDCLRKADADTPISSSNNAAFSSADINDPLAALEDTVRSRPAEADTSETSVPLVSSSTATSSDSGVENFRPASRGSAVKREPHSSGGVQKSKGRKSQRQNSNRAQGLPVLQPNTDFSSMSGTMQPFDVIKNYGMGGTVSLQQLNDKIRKHFSMS